MDIVESRSTLILVAVALTLLQRLDHCTRKTYVSYVTSQIERVLTTHWALQLENGPRVTHNEEITFFDTGGARRMATHTAQATFWTTRVADNTLTAHLSLSVE